MAEVNYTIGRPEVTRLEMKKSGAPQKGAQIQLKVQQNNKVAYNPEKPLEAVSYSIFTVTDAEKLYLNFEIEVACPVVVSTFVDNLDEFVAQKCGTMIISAVSEKVNAVCLTIGVPSVLPPLKFTTRTEMGS